LEFRRVLFRSIRRTAKASIRDLPVVGTAARGAGYAPSGAAPHDRVTAPDVGAQLDARRPHPSALQGGPSSEAGFGAVEAGTRAAEIVASRHRQRRAGG